MKRVLSLVLAFILAFSLAVNAFAATGISVSTDPKKVNPGETFVVTITLENDIPISEGATMMQGELFYEEEVLDFVSVEKISGDLTSAAKNNKKAKVDFYYLSFDNSPKAFAKGELVKITFKVKDDLSNSVHLDTAFEFMAYVENNQGEAVADITFNKETKVLVTVGEHSWDEGVVTKDPTCSEAGVRTFTCECGETKTEEEPATGEHTAKEAVKENEVAATCKEDGSYEMVVYCSVCSEEISREKTVVSKENVEHTPAEAVKENEKAASCKDNGSYDEVVYCSVCEKEISRTTVTVPATGDHVYETEVERVEATCEKDGYVIKACGCGEQAEPEVLPKHGHTWGTVKYTWKEDFSACLASRECVCTEEECDETEGRESANITSKTTPATCSKEGETVYTVTFTDDWAETQTKTVVIEMDEDAHNWDEGKVTTEPTCSKVGVKTFTCKNNAEHTYTEDVAIKEDAHAWTVSYEWSDDGKACTATRVCGNNEEHNLTVEATVTSVVAKEATCSAMGDTRYEAIFAEDWAHDYKAITDIPVDEDAHEWGEWKVVTEPDYVNEGLEKRVCKLSDEHFEEKAIAKLVPTATEKTEGPDGTKEYDIAYQEGVVMVPAGLENEYPNQQAVKDALKAKVENGDLEGEVNLVFREVTVGYYENGAFVPVSNEEFFENGRTIEILLKYPNGADKNDKFEVYHLTDKGDIEKCVIKDKTDEGLVIEVGSLSPFAIAYESVDNNPGWPSNPGKPSKPSNKPNPGITIITPEDEKEEANPNTGAPVVCSFDLTAAGVVVLAATAAVLEIKRRK